MRRLLFFIPLILIGFQLKAQYKTSYVVAKDGSGDFESIQKAIEDCKAFPDKRITIMVKNGVYREKVKVHSWNSNITMIGESRDKTIISYDDYFDKIDKGRNSTFFSWTLLVEGDDFILENLTVENTAGEVGQAVALHIEADRVVVKNCDIEGNQDTIYLSGERSRQYFNNCMISGTTDYVFGGATAVFEDCTLFTTRDSYITAASTPQGVEFGFVFIDCQLKAPDSVSQVYLGRPWRDYAKTVFIQCDLGDFILSEGWNNWGSEEKEKTSFYAEFENTGLGSDISGRADWSHQLSKSESKKYSLKSIFSVKKDHSSNSEWYKR